MTFAKGKMENVINLFLQFRKENDPQFVSAVMCSFTAPDNLKKDTICSVFERCFVETVQRKKENTIANFFDVLDETVKSVNKELGITSHMQVADAVANLML